MDATPHLHLAGRLRQAIGSREASAPFRAYQQGLLTCMQIAAALAPCGDADEETGDRGERGIMTYLDFFYFGAVQESFEIDFDDEISLQMIVGLL